jgi:hypothetical protein
MEAWTRDTATDPDATRFVFAYTNRDVDALNAEPRQVRRDRDEPSGQDVRFGRCCGALVVGPYRLVKTNCCPLAGANMSQPEAVAGGAGEGGGAVAAGAVGKIAGTVTAPLRTQATCRASPRGREGKPKQKPVRPSRYAVQNDAGALVCA